MGRHRQVRGGRRVAPISRPRYKRLTAAGGALSVTLVAVLGGMGVLPVEGGSAEAAAVRPPTQDAPVRGAGGATADAGDGGQIRLSDSTPTRAPGLPGRVPRATRASVPADSGQGRRVVFDMTDQRVWLVDHVRDGDVVRRSYLVSGSVTDNLKPGNYRVYSKSVHAWGVDDSGTMRYMVRFAHGTHAAIGFHDIPELDGEKVQTRAMLGTPQSHGCIRQWRPDAKALWRFAPVDTPVVVVA